MLEIYSPSGREERIREFLAAELRRLGFVVSQDAVGNLTAESGTDGPSILLCGHMDTVPGEIPVTADLQRICGRGAVDAKGPLAAMILGVHSLRNAGVNKGRIILAAVVDEEGQSSGIRELVKQRHNFDYAVFGEPSGAGNITIGYKGSLYLTMGIRTSTGHSAAFWLFQNAVEHASKLWELIRNIRFENESMDSKFESTTMCLVRIQGGLGGNKVPDHCDFDVDVRIPPGKNTAHLKDIMDKVVRDFAKENKGVTVRIDVKDSTPAFLTRKDTLVARAFARSIIKNLGSRPSFLKKTGTGDINILADAWPIPMITYGPGDSHLDHTDQEHIEIEEYLKSIEVYRDALDYIITNHRTQLASS